MIAEYCTASHQLLTSYKLAVEDYRVAVDALSSGHLEGASWAVLFTLKRTVDEKRSICEACRHEMDQHHLEHGC